MTTEDTLILTKDEAVSIRSHFQATKWGSEDETLIINSLLSFKYIKCILNDGDESVIDIDFETSPISPLRYISNRHKFYKILDKLNFIYNNKKQ